MWIRTGRPFGSPASSMASVRPSGVWTVRSTSVGGQDDVRGLDHDGDLAAFGDAELLDGLDGDRGDQAAAAGVEGDVGDGLSGGDADDRGRDLVARTQLHDCDSLSLWCGTTLADRSTKAATCAASGVIAARRLSTVWCGAGGSAPSR